MLLTGFYAKKDTAIKILHKQIQTHLPIDFVQAFINI